MSQDIREIFGISPDPHIHVFRRTLSELKEWASRKKSSAPTIAKHMRATSVLFSAGYYSN